jgi:predicted secreted protein
MIMKKYLFILFALVLAASCNDKEFLEEHSYSNDSQGFYQSERAMEIGLASCYSEVQYLIFGNMRQTHSWMLMGVGLDSFAQTSANDHFSNWSTLT